MTVDCLALAVGQTGTADVTPGHVAGSGRLAAPKPLEDFKEQWPPVERPAEKQEVTPVPLGGEQATTGTDHLMLAANVFGNADSAGTGGQMELRGAGTFNSIRRHAVGRRHRRLAAVLRRRLERGGAHAVPAARCGAALRQPR